MQVLEAGIYSCARSGETVDLAEVKYVDLNSLPGIYRAHRNLMAIKRTCHSSHSNRFCFTTCTIGIALDALSKMEKEAFNDPDPKE